MKIVEATLDDYPTIQNMARFYVYDMSRDCGFISKEWAMPADGLYESFDFKDFFENPAKKAYLVKVDDELAGFVLLNQTASAPDKFFVEEFFIVAKFQGKGIGTQVAHQIWTMHPGLWELSVIPENKNALIFWRKAVSQFTQGQYKEEIRTVDYDQHQPKRYFLSFKTSN